MLSREGSGGTVVPGADMSRTPAAVLAVLLIAAGCTGGGDDGAPPPPPPPLPPHDLDPTLGTDLAL